MLNTVHRKKFQKIPLFRYDTNIVRFRILPTRWLKSYRILRIRIPYLQQCCGFECGLVSDSTWSVNPVPEEPKCGPLTGKIFLEAFPGAWKVNEQVLR
jgi:hypothetical protein